MIWLAFASLFSAPAPVGTYPWFSIDDIPARILSEREQYSLLVRALVSPTGVLQGCEIERSVPDTALDAYTCSLVKARAKLRPAKWIDGLPVEGVHRSWVVWTVQPSIRKHDTDLIVTVGQFPKGVRSPAYFPIIFAADEKGAPLACGPQNGDENPALIGLVCGEFVKRFVAIPPKNRNGALVHSVQNATVMLVKK